MADSGVPRDAYVPHFDITTKVNGKVIGEFRRPMPDPFHRTEVTVGWRDLLRTVVRRRALVLEVSVGADSRTMENVLALNPDHLGYPGTPSRKAWEASLNEGLSTRAKADFLSPDDHHG